MAKYFHATNFENLGPILCEGIKTLNIENGVFLCTSPDESVRFPYVRGLKDILVIEVDVPKKNVTEVFDHNYNFFKCRAYLHKGPISPDKLMNFTRYQF